MNDIIEARPAAVATQDHQIPADSPMAMAIAAVQSGLSPEQISAMMDLQDRYNAAQAKKAFDQAFAAFKAECVEISKKGKVKGGPLDGRSYAKLHDWVSAATPALSRHGLSSFWRLTRDDKDWIEVTCYLRHVGGHEESVSMGGPPDSGGSKNAIQARASAKSYLERYTFKAITGLSEQDDDDDGNGGSTDQKNESHDQKKNEPESRPAYTDEQIDQFQEKWRAAITAGKTTADRLIKTISASYTLTAKQRAAIKGLEAEDTFVADMEKAEQEMANG
ncbi:MAG: ERF family protein [Porticoccaceae bacterium]